MACTHAAGLRDLKQTEIRSRDKNTRRDNNRLEIYVWSSVFRMNTRPKLIEALGKLATKANNSRGAEWKDVFSFGCKSMNHQIPSKKHLWTHKPMVKMGQNEHAAMTVISRNQDPHSTSCLMQYMFYSNSSGSIARPFPILTCKTGWFFDRVDAKINILYMEQMGNGRYHC